MTLKKIRTSSEDRHFMSEAISQSAKSPGKVKVGAVVVLNGEIIGKGYRDQTRQGIHAEHVAVAEAKNSGHTLNGSTVYTTLEPCVSTKSQCAQLLIDEGVTSVVIGNYDPHPEINRCGWKLLRDSEVELRDFDPDLRPEVAEINAEFLSYFNCTNPKESNGAKFDYLANGGKYRIYFAPDDVRCIDTCWDRKGTKTIWARRGSHTQEVAIAKFANNFADIDDPTAYDFGSSSVAVDEGQIAIFRNSQGCVLVNVESVFSGAPYDSELPSVKIKFEVRAYQ